ncbi:hypothetical protein J6590_094102 [Homalodisca vitripennis]|nr:hypothetical protein J6590_094102 [Homalodisca vitripennis]
MVAKSENAKKILFKMIESQNKEKNKVKKQKCVPKNKMKVESESEEENDALCLICLEPLSESKPGIFPTCRERVLQKLKPCTDPKGKEENLPKVIGENFKQYLEDMKARLLIPSKRGKRFQLPVESGKSVSYEEVQMYVENREKAEEEKAKKRKSNQEIKSKLKKSRSTGSTNPKQNQKGKKKAESEEELPLDSDLSDIVSEQNI